MEVAYIKIIYFKNVSHIIIRDAKGYPRLLNCGV